MAVESLEDLLHLDLFEYDTYMALYGGDEVVTFGLDVDPNLAVGFWYVCANCVKKKICFVLTFM